MAKKKDNNDENNLSEDISTSTGALVTTNKVYFKVVGDVGVKEKNVVVSSEQEKVLNVCYIERRAISEYNGEYFVYKEQEDGSFRATKVKPGASVGLYVVVEEGLSEGDVIALPD